MNFKSKIKACSIRTECTALHVRKRWFLSVVTILAFHVCSSFHCLKAEPIARQTVSGHSGASIAAQSEFSVASVRQNLSDAKRTSNVPLGSGYTYSPTGGLFTATNQPLFLYIVFAYKIEANQRAALFASLPQWAKEDRFDIQARADGDPTKDQFREMMKSLLKERCNLAIRKETIHGKVLALRVARADRLGPQLEAHAKGSDCSTPAPDAVLQGSHSAGLKLPSVCGGIVTMKPSSPGLRRVGARDVSMEYFASALPAIGLLHRTVLDRTGLSDQFDFVIEFSPENGESSSRDVASTQEGPTFLEALREQLGLSLKEEEGSLDVFVVDNIEHPKPN